MTSFVDRVEEMNKAIRREAHRLGLVFAAGPDPLPLTASAAIKPALGETNGQERAVYLFAVAPQ
jgi:hypothetical protein